ncbi:MAG: hypothetical protein ACRDPO_33160 [Streptosporangiaceae bacterium]
MAGSGSRRRRGADRLPESPPDNELPGSLDLGPLLWRSAHVGIAVAGARVYSTGVAFTLVALSKGVSLRGGDDWSEDRHDPFSDIAGSLTFSARPVPVMYDSWHRGEHRIQADIWTPFPPDDDLVFSLEWPGEGIEHSEFRVPRSAAAKATPLWEPGLLVEMRARHDELTPVFRVQVEPWAEGSDLMRLRVTQDGPPGLDRLDSLMLHISNDDSYWPDERNITAKGHNYDEVENQVWAPYRFTPGTGPGQARADRHGREVTHEARLASGDELSFQLEPTRPGSWAGMPAEQWQRQRGRKLRLGITAVHQDHRPWHLLAQVQITAGRTWAASVSRSRTQTIPPGDTPMVAAS